MNEKKKIGFIGTGMMGLPMARNLLKSGYDVIVYNRTPEKAASLIELGASVEKNPLNVAQPGGIVMSCVSEDDALTAVVGENGQLAECLGKNGIHVSMSTILPSTAARLARQQSAFGGYYIAAPVMGRPDIVLAKKQSYFVAGDENAKKRVAPLLEAIAMKIFDFGALPENANVAKLAANFLIASAIEAMAEAFTLVSKNNGDADKLLDALGSTLFACPIYQNYGRQILDKKYTEPLFKLRLGQKDVRLVAETATESKTPMRFARVLQDRFSEAAAHGLSDHDWTAIASEVEKEAGL
ncbi:MAG: NAD(P)-dependent oxidoreductase [Desulfobacterales bacterium]|jgi:3-hydroxyisobutyrate dehydrogenase-like beta-hydroxyacid dehydrogenase